MIFQNALSLLLVGLAIATPHSPAQISDTGSSSFKRLDDHQYTARNPDETTNESVELSAILGPLKDKRYYALEMIIMSVEDGKGGSSPDIAPEIYKARSILGPWVGVVIGQVNVLGQDEEDGKYTPRCFNGTLYYWAAEGKPLATKLIQVPFLASTLDPSLDFILKDRLQFLKEVSSSDYARAQQVAESYFKDKDYKIFNAETNNWNTFAKAFVQELN